MSKRNSDERTLPPKVAQRVTIGLTAEQSELLLEYVNQHFVSINKKPEQYRLRHAALCFVSFACALPPATIQALVRFLCRYGSAEGFNHFFLLNQLAVGALALWRGDTSGTKGLRVPGSNTDSSQTARLNPDELLALWRKEMDEEEKREMIETLKHVASGLEADLKGGGLQP